MNDPLHLTKTDFRALELGDSNYINNKGAGLYVEPTYDKAVEYYRLAAAMGNVQAISNLGYCYLYGRSIEPNTDLAVAYFTLAAEQKNVDAAYKLCDIYGSDKWGLKDRELSVYYYRMAATWLTDEDWEEYGAIVWNRRLQKYPSLCYALGREMTPGGAMPSSIEVAYQFLKQAERGYEIALLNGDSFYEKSLNGVKKLLADPCFDLIRERYDIMFAQEYDRTDENDDDGDTDPDEDEVIFFTS